MAELQKKRAKPLNPPPPYSPTVSSLRQRLDERAVQEEIQGLVQFSFFRPHLAELLLACRQASLEILVLKGAALAETLYPRPSLRPFGDIDVFIHEADAASARTVLEDLGYVVDAIQWEDLARGHGCQANFFKNTPRGAVVAELHTQLVNNTLFFRHFHELADAQIALAGLWERTRVVTLAGVPARVLGAEDQLLHLCLHLAGHYLAAPQSLRDIAQLCDYAHRGTLRLDWPLFLALARQMQAEPACFCGMYIARSLLGVPVPEAVIEALSPGPSRRRLETLAAARAADLTMIQTEPLRLPILWLLMGSPRVRLRAIRRIVFPSRRWLVIHYFYALFDRPEPPRFPRIWRHSSLQSARDVFRFAGTYLVLYLIHWGALVRRAVALLFRALRR